MVTGSGRKVILAVGSKNGRPTKLFALLDQRMLRIVIVDCNAYCSGIVRSPCYISWKMYVLVWLGLQEGEGAGRTGVE